MDRIAVLIPAKHESAEAVEKPLRSVLSQKGVEIEKIVIAAGTEDDHRRFSRQFADDDIVEVVKAGGNVKGETVNNALKRVSVRADYVFLIDAGDELSSDRYIRELLEEDATLAFGRIRYRGRNLTGLMVGLQFDVVSSGISFWGDVVGSAPVFTTGTLFKATFLLEEGLPENLAEDVTLGLTHTWRKVGFVYRADLEVWMDDPAGLKENFFQQSRWWAGMYQACAEALRSRNLPGIGFAVFVLGSFLASFLTTYVLPLMYPWTILISITGRVIYSVLAALECSDRRGPLWALAVIPCQFMWTFFVEWAAVYGLVWLAIRGNVWYSPTRASEGDDHD
ncbi:glycosyltransferase [Methanopyrus sp.]